MSTQIQRAVPDWIVLGDNSQYEFLKWLVDSSAFENLFHHAVWVQYSNHISVRKRDNDWWVYTNRILPGMTIYFPGAMDEATASVLDNEWVSSTGFLIFEEFPFRKDCTEKDIVEIHARNPATAVLTILMDLPRRYGSTDDSPSEDGIKTAQESYRHDKLPIFVAKNATDVLHILNWQELFSNSWKRKTTTALQNLRMRIDELEFDYKNILEDFKDESLGEEAVLSQSTFSKICSFRSVQKHKQSYIWDNFTQELIRRLFLDNRKGGLYPAVELYCEVLYSSSIAVWDIRKDGMLFAEYLKQSLSQTLTEQRCGKKCTTLYSEDAFLNDVTRPVKADAESIIVRFTKAVNAFVETGVFDLLKERLEERYQQLEDGLS